MGWPSSSRSTESTNRRPPARDDDLSDRKEEYEGNNEAYALRQACATPVAIRTLVFDLDIAAAWSGPFGPVPLAVGRIPKLRQQRCRNDETADGRRAIGPANLSIMDEAKLLRLATWIAEAGLEGAREKELLDAFCARAVSAGLPLSRALVAVDTLHPTLEGRVYEWRRLWRDAVEKEYGRTDSPDDDGKWRRSPFFRLIETGAARLRRRLDGPEAELAEFPILADLRQIGATDYVAMVNRFGAGGSIGRMDCVYSSWTTDRPGGFADREIAALEVLVPPLALAIKSAVVARIAETIVETYLGPDAGRRVLRGNIERGVTERITAVLWFSDLHGFTRITDTMPPTQVIPLLNDYADAIISAVDASQGEVLKLIGDGVLAIFNKGDGETTCRQALDAVADARRRVAAANARRHMQGLPATRFYVGLHYGEVFYGNIGSADRLDFTVVGPAVNETSRIAAMCRAVGQDALLSSAFAQAAPGCRNRLVSVGRYALRGVRRPQELFTIDPEA